MDSSFQLYGRASLPRRGHSQRRQHIRVHGLILFGVEVLGELGQVVGQEPGALPLHAHVLAGGQPLVLQTLVDGQPLDGALLEDVEQEAGGLLRHVRVQVVEVVADEGDVLASLGVVLAGEG